MDGPLVTVGVPVYRGHELLPAALACVQNQTYRHLDVLISVDGPDAATVAACAPFLRDLRFRMHVQPTRLGWAGNVAWTMRNRRGEFYIYQQQDDVVSPTYVADLVEAAQRWPGASICYAKVKVSGLQNMTLPGKPVLGDPINRALTYMERLDPSMLRGLIRGSALDATSGLRFNEFEGFSSEQAFIAELALAGEFRLVAGPTYYKRIHGDNLHLKWHNWPEERKRAAWASLAASMIEVIVPAGRTLEERWRLLYVVLDRFLIARGVTNWGPLRRAKTRMLRLRMAEAAAPTHGGRSAKISRPRPGWLPAAIDLLRAGGLVPQSRFMFCDIDKNDFAARGEVLRGILRRLQRSSSFDVYALLGSEWGAVEKRAAKQFKLSTWDGA